METDDIDNGKKSHNHYWLRFLYVNCYIAVEITLLLYDKKIYYEKHMGEGSLSKL